MNVLVACEFSQVVTKAFRDRGHIAYSCDLLPTEGNQEWHIQGDVLNHLNDGWDLMIAHPPCTFLCNSGVQWLYKREDRWTDMILGALFFKKLLVAPIDRIAIENPIPHKYALSVIGSGYNQIIQPYQFGHPERKATCLWLKNLPNLEPTKFVELPKDKSKAQRLHYLPPSEDRWKLRSITYQGIADAMAEQWGSLPILG